MMTLAPKHTQLRAALTLLLIAFTSPQAVSANERPGIVSAKAENACFGTRALLTNETDWEKKWRAAGATIPELSTINQLNLGTKATLVLLFSCPELVEDKARIECDIKITKADGTTLLQQGGLPCYDAALSRPREGEHLSEIWLDFNVTEDDGTGPVEIRIGMTDRNLGERLLMVLPFEFTGKALE